MLKGYKKIMLKGYKKIIHKNNEKILSEMKNYKWKGYKDSDSGIDKDLVLPSCSDIWGDTNEVKIYKEFL